MTLQSKAVGEAAAENIREKSRIALEKQGITYEYLIKKLKKELNAKETKHFQHEGEVTEIREVVDWTTRQKARIDAHKLRGDYPVEQKDLNLSGTVDHTLSPEIAESIAAIFAEPLPKKRGKK